MKNEHNRKILETAFPPMDAHFDRTVRSTLEEIVHSERAARRLPLRLALPALLILLTLGTAIAATQGLNLFNFFSSWTPVPTVQPEAYELMQHNVAAYSFEHVDICIREAAWDGRVLRMLYSVRDRAVTRRYTDEEIQAEGWHMEGADLDGITAHFGCDYVYINGVTLSMTGSMATRAGEENGEVLVALESNLLDRIPDEAPDLTLGDTFDVCLPILGKGTPQELHFTVSNTNIPGVRSLPLPAPQKGASPDAITLEVTDLTISPIRVYLSVRATLPTSYTDAQIDSVVGNALDVTLSDLRRYDTGAGVINGNVEFGADEQGEWQIYYHIPKGEHAIVQVDAEFATAPQYPDTFTVSVLGQTISIPNSIP